MDRDDTMPVEADDATMWTLSRDRKLARLELPALPLEGLPRPVVIKLDFDAEMIDAMIDRLTVLRARMLPDPPKPGRRNQGQNP